MRQVPHYLIIGKSRVPTHIQHYLSLASHLSLLISDAAREAFISVLKDPNIRGETQ